jgi:hypothetical protein
LHVVLVEERAQRRVVVGPLQDARRVEGAVQVEEVLDDVGVVDRVGPLGEVQRERVDDVALVAVDAGRL